MKIDLTTVLNKRCSEIKVDYSFDVKDVETDVTLPCGMEIEHPVRVKGAVTDKNNCMFLNVTVEADYLTSCDRCLSDIHGTTVFDFERMVSVEVPAEYDPFDESLDDVVYVSESAVDVDADILEELVLELPAYHLCSDDCKGLCPKCGKRLSDGECNCTEEKEIDPRLKKLQKLLDNFE